MTTKLYNIYVFYLLGFLIIKSFLQTEFTVIRSFQLNGQNSQFNGNQFTQCNRNRLQRCQQSIIGLVSQNFGGIGNGMQSNQFLQCSNLRRNLDCVLIYTPICQNNVILRTETNSGDELITSAKSYLDRVCDQSGGWRASQCYQTTAIQQCEFQYQNSQQSPSAALNTKCPNFQLFRNCVANAVRLSCSIQDIQLLSSYLIDKTQDLLWTCPSTPNNFRNNPFNSQYGITNQNTPYNQFNSFNPNNQNRQINGQYYPRNLNNINNQFVPNPGNGQFGFSNLNNNNGQFGPNNANGLSGEFGANNSNGPYSQYGITNHNNSPFNQLSTTTQSSPYNQYGI